MLKQLGKYEIIRTLGQGAMGEVYLAHHSTIGRDVAIKVILPSEAKGEDAEERFRREASAAGKLSHPNIVTIYDFDKEGDLLYLIMEYVEGEDLDDIIAHQSMTPSQFLEVLAQVCDGLSYAHRNGVIHRDIKPSNIRVIRDGKRVLAKVMDFGIARRPQDSQMTSTGIVVGTVSYMAPEYIQTGRPSAQGDLWAVGVMLYECLTCRKPFGGDNTTSILFKIISEMPAPIDPEDYQGISPSIRDILDRILSKDPANRFQTAEEFAKALRACKNPSWSVSLQAASALPTPSLPAPKEEPTVPVQSVSVTPTTVKLPQPETPAAGAHPQSPLPPTVAPPPATSGRKSGLGLKVLALTGIGLLLAAGGGAYLLFGRRATPVTTTQTPPAPPETGTPAVATATPAPPPTQLPAPTPAKVPVQGVPESKPQAITPPAVAPPPQPQSPKSVAPSGTAQPVFPSPAPPPATPPPPSAAPAPAPVAAPSPGKWREMSVRVGNTSIEMVQIPAGRFRMGSETGRKNEVPVHEVTIERAFWMSKYPVTQGQWQALMGSNPSRFKAAGPDAPVEQVTMITCEQFVSRLNSSQSSWTFRIPTEAEWEHACRAGSSGERYGELDAIAWYGSNSGKTTHPVGKKQPNGFGLYDMLGNVWQWCADLQHDDYQKAPADGSAWIADSYFLSKGPKWSGEGGRVPAGHSNFEPVYVTRGGSWKEGGKSIRAAYRNMINGSSKYDDLGLRVVCTPK